MEQPAPVLKAEVVQYVLLTDIHASSRLGELYPKEYAAALDGHNAAVEQAVSGQGGEVYKNLGDGYLALFDNAADCLACAILLQQEFATFAPIADGEPFMVRIVAHGGALRRTGNEYYGPALNRAARICQACHPGQVLASAAVASHLAGKPPEGAALLDLGQHQLRDLAGPEQLYQLDHPDFRLHEFPPLLTLGSRPNNLVSQPNEFIGRRRELSELTAMLLNSRRLITITAPGGYGKSRLAAQLCADLLPSFERGVYYVELAPVPEAGDIPPALAAATGFQFFGNRDPQQQLIDYLRGKEMLLCLDNFEHILAGAPFISEILREAPQVKLVITSREPLRISGEQVYILEPLPVGAADDADRQSAEAVLLFADRAALVSASFKLDGQTLPAVHDLCHKLNGIPLAIELAAAWVDNFSLSELAAELDQQLELTARLGDTAERHRSLRASLDWSWNLLREERRKMLMQLATFRGGCFIDAAEAVVGLKGLALRRELAALVDKSWLYTRELDDRTRYFLRDAVSREYAFEKLSETRAEGAGGLYEQAALAHARYFSQIMTREGAKLKSGGQLDALQRIAEEKQNIYEAIDTLASRVAENDTATAAAESLSPMLPALVTYFDTTGSFRDMVVRFQALCNMFDGLANHRKVKLRAMLGWATGLYRIGEYQQALELSRAAGAIAEELGELDGLAASLRTQGNIEWQQRNYTESSKLQNQALELCRKLDDRHGIGVALNNLGNVEYQQANYESAHAMHSQALGILRELGDLRWIAGSLNNLGMVEGGLGHASLARDLYDEALGILRKIGARNAIAGTVNNLGVVEYDQGNYRTARELFNQALAIHQETGNRQWAAFAFNNIGNAEVELGNCAAARERYEHALALQRELGDVGGCANALRGLGLAAYGEGDLAGARDYYHQALSTLRETTAPFVLINTLGSLGLVELDLGSYREATKLFLEWLAARAELGSSGRADAVIADIGRLLLACGRSEAGAACLYGNQHQVASLQNALNEAELQRLNQALAAIEHPETGLPAEERTRLKAQAEAMSLDELAEFARQALEELDKAQS